MGIFYCSINARRRLYLSNSIQQNTLLDTKQSLKACVGFHLKESPYLLMGIFLCKAKAMPEQQHTAEQTIWYETIAESMRRLSFKRISPNPEPDMAQGKEGNYWEFKIIFRFLTQQCCSSLLFKDKEHAPQGEGFKKVQPINITLTKCLFFMC